MHWITSKSRLFPIFFLQSSEYLLMPKMVTDVLFWILMKKSLVFMAFTDGFWISLLRHEEWWKKFWLENISLQAKSFEYHGKKSWILPWWKCKTEVAPHFHTVPNQDFMSKTFSTLEANPNRLSSLKWLQLALNCSCFNWDEFLDKQRSLAQCAIFCCTTTHNWFYEKAKVLVMTFSRSIDFFQWSHTVKSESKWLSNAYIID